MSTPSPRRAADARRIRVGTRVMAVGAAVATALFGGLAAAATHAKSSSGHGSSAGSAQAPQLAAPASAPEQSLAPPAAQSGGS